MQGDPPPGSQRPAAVSNDPEAEILRQEVDRLEQEIEDLTGQCVRRWYRRTVIGPEMLYSGEAGLSVRRDLVLLTPGDVCGSVPVAELAQFPLILLVARRFRLSVLIRRLPP